MVRTLTRCLNQWERCIEARNRALHSLRQGEYVRLQYLQGRESTCAFSTQFAETNQLIASGQLT